MDKVRKKLSGWKGRKLYMAGRVTMAQSCLLSFPPYVLQATLISIATCNEIEKICRDFILCSDANNRKIHLMSWEMTCKPKDQGGLGFRSLRMLNQAYFLKLGWSMMKDPNTLWVRLLRMKYNCGPSVISQVKTSPKASHIWKGIVNN